LFATGLSLQAAAQLTKEPMAVERIMRSVDEIDISIRQVRSTIFELHQLGTAQQSVRSEIITVCDDASKALGFKPLLDIEGPIDSAVDEQVRGHLLLSLREALSNVARHARASAVDVQVAVASGHLTLRVTDDGVGYHPPSGQRSSGIDNMLVRAEALGGVFSIANREQGGTMVTWDVPLAPTSQP
jgi:signal transduction histidine kinase